MEQRLPGELLSLELVWKRRVLLVQAEVASETARSVLLRELAAIPGAPLLEDVITVTGFFEPATDDEWFLSCQPAPIDEVAVYPERSSLHDRQERAIVRHPTLAAVTPLVAGAEIELSVDLLLEAMDSSSPGLELAVLPDGWEELVVDVIATSASFVRPSQGRIHVFENGGSRGARLRTVLRHDLSSGEGVKVSLTFFENDRHCGDWNTNVGAVVRAPGDDRGHDVSPSPRMALGRSTEAPVLTVIIRQIEQGRLDWLWQLRRDINVGLTSITGTMQMDDPAEYGRRLIQECPLMPAATVKRRMTSIGEDVWSHTPADFKATYSALRTQLGPEFTIQLLLDEHSVPWELMVPDGADGRPLYLTHPIARWPVANGLDRPGCLPSGSTCSFVPEYADNGTLPAARCEGVWLETNLGAVRCKPSMDKFLALMECTDAPEQVAMVHFAGHGRAATFHETAGLLMEDGWVLTADLNSTTTRLGRRDRSMVVLNACEMANVNSELRWVSGWAPHLVHHGFGAVVAPLWRVQDEAARDVVIAGISRIYCDGEGLGAAFAQARSTYANASSAPYAFVTYGDVMAKMCH
ncbi:CHAT domain-containing protein [Acetobacter okinawensis]|uniref:CHAT domain-containing protein n=1 Tax=Acetobacter okinawensis TaxID=1076594 RepID=UPI00209D4C85|nr:CHAT domain-containing protein [Acetobacter okinawensis]MCP1214361.1 CHAT domain-containing protein [Acetobacter okinawensis]